MILFFFPLRKVHGGEKKETRNDVCLHMDYVRERKRTMTMQNFFCFSIVIFLSDLEKNLYIYLKKKKDQFIFVRRLVFFSLCVYVFFFLDM
jgi:hypothetical protein